METPYGRGHDAPLRPFHLVDDDTLRGLVAMRRAQGMRAGLISVALGLAGQGLLHGPVSVERHPFLALGLMYGFPIAFIFLASAWSNDRFRRACRRAGLSAEAVATFRAHLRKVPPRVPPMPADEMVAYIRALENARQREQLAPPPCAAPGADGA